MRPTVLPFVLAMLAGCAGANFDVAALDSSETGALGPDAPDAAPEETATPGDDAPGPDADAETAPSVDAGPDTAPVVDAAPDTLTAPPDTFVAPPDTATAPDTAAPPPDTGPTFAVTDVIASSLKVSTSCKFTIIGTNLPASLFVKLPNCLTSAGTSTSGTSTSQTFQCTPWASGESYVNVYDVPGHLVFTKTITFQL